MLDLLIKNGLICDGSGDKAYVGDVGVKDGKIALVSTPSDTEAAQVLDAAGLVVSPAFIDMHSHSDTSYLDDDRCQAKIYQGVATEVVGQCGSSPFPRSQEQLTKLKQRGDSFASGSFEKLRNKAQAAGKKMSINLVQLVGHNAIRRGVVGLGARAANAEENQLSAYLLEQNLSQGAWGLSLGLGYSSGIFSDMDELVALGNVCYKYDALITSHMRDEADKVFESVDEMIELHRRTGARVHIAHLKISSKRLWGQADRLYEKIQKAQQSGVAITADMYPYNASSTGLTNVLPYWAMDGGAQGALKRLTTPGEEYDRVYAHLCKNYPDTQDGDRIYVISTDGRYPICDDKTIGRLSAELGLSVPDTLVKALIETECRANCIFFSMSEADYLYLLGKDIAIGSDGSARPFDPAKNDGKPHPRAYGTFVRFLRLRRELDLCPIETAIYRMTKKPADIVGLKDRGTLTPGLAADITVFDQNTVADTATFQNPFQKPVGVSHVIINGRFAIRDGAQTNERLGGYLLRQY